MRKLSFKKNISDAIKHIPGRIKGFKSICLKVSVEA